MAERRLPTCLKSAARGQVLRHVLFAAVAGALTLLTMQPTPAATRQDYGKVGYMTLTGPIDRLRKRYLSRVIEAAREQQVDTLIVHINTDGGTVFDARDMFKQVLDQDRGGLRMVALVDYRAISAGAMVAYAHQELYVTQTASIGDIGVIFKSAEGEIKYAPEKIETVVRTLLTQAAELRGWNRGLLLKMTAHQQLLYRITLPDGSVHFVIQDDYPDFLSKHPGLDEDDPEQVIVYRGKDRLITLTGREAASLGMATALVTDKDDLFRRMGVAADEIIDFSPRLAERTAWLMAPFTPILAGLALLLVVFELKTPGIGLWAALAALFGGLFLIAHFYLDLAENVEVVLLVLGLVLLGLEMYAGAGGGVLGLAGGALVIAGLLMAFVPNEIGFDLSDPRFLEALASAAWSTVLAMAVFIAGLLVFISRMPGWSLSRKIGMAAEITADSTGTLEADSQILIGKVAQATEMLRPAGTVELDGRTFSARVEHAGYAAAGSDVEIIRVEFGELVVRMVEPKISDSGDGA